MIETAISPINEDWYNLLKEQFEAQSFSDLHAFIQNEIENGKEVYPTSKNIFTAFNTIPLDQVKVVILGQDPYHGPGQAHGLSFSVNKGVKIPPSLKNIYKELEQDIEGFITPNHGYLMDWANQGVLLLNAILTVNKGEAASHHKQGWEQFTDATIQKISSELNNVVFILWGNYAQQKIDLIDSSKHLVLKSAHPSPFSARNGFFGCKHFSKTNAYLKENDLKEIDWILKGNGLLF